MISWIIIGTVVSVLTNVIVGHVTYKGGYNKGRTEGYFAAMREAAPHREVKTPPLPRQEY